MANTQRREHYYDPGLVRADRDNNPDPTGTPSLLIVNEMGIDAGSACVTPEQIDRAMRLAYTWRDCFVTSLNEIGEASRIVRHSQIEDNPSISREVRPIFSANTPLTSSVSVPQSTRARDLGVNGLDEPYDRILVRKMRHSVPVGNCRE